MINTAPDTIVTIEIKNEMRNPCGNFFFETWSNLDYCMRRLGWMWTCKADLLWYYFIEEDDLYIIDFRKLFDWAHVQDRLKCFRLVEQGKADQFNRTMGRVVPIRIIEQQVGFKLRHPRRELQNKGRERVSRNEKNRN